MKKQKVVASIEARMTSSRLPGKVLMPAIEGVSMLEFMVNRVKKSKKVNDIVIATTLNNTDDPIVELCEKMGIKYYRGSEDDVLLRVLEAHNTFQTDIIVELTGDCPLIDPRLVDQIIDVYFSGTYDYVSNAHVRSYPDGFDVQVFSLAVLKEVAGKTQDKYDRENVSSYIYGSGNYTLKEVIAPSNEYWPELRVTLDDTGDYLLIKNIIEHLLAEVGEDFYVADVVSYMKNNSGLLELNKNARVNVASYQVVAKK